MRNNLSKRGHFHTRHGVGPLRAGCVEVGALSGPRILQNLFFYVQPLKIRQRDNCLQPVLIRLRDYNSWREFMRGSQGCVETGCHQASLSLKEQCLVLDIALMPVKRLTCHTLVLATN